MLISDNLIRELRVALPELRLAENEPMSAHCSFRIGGKARLMAFPEGKEAMTALLCKLKQLSVRPFIMGKGTNLLVTDAPLDRIVIKTDGLAQIRHERERFIVAGAGASLAKIAAVAQRLSLSGFEFAHGIPGSLGGAVCMNAGAYGGEMKDVVTETLFLNDTLEPDVALGEGHGFHYRRSVFSSGAAVILESRIELTPGDPKAIAARMKELSDRRRESQPLDVPSAGSTFKRPKGTFAAQLIDEAGLKGFRVGGAAVSPKHAGFVVNDGGASFDDVLAVMRHVEETVYARTGIRLEPEVKIIQ